MEEQLNFPWYDSTQVAQREESLTLADQIAHAQALLANGKRLEELTTKREQLTADLAAVDDELSTMLGAPTNGSTRAKQKCSKCGEEGHTKRTCKKE